jgi:hypothetical protein
MPGKSLLYDPLTKSNLILSGFGATKAIAFITQNRVIRQTKTLVFIVHSYILNISSDLLFDIT